jgi:hypothetical protein
MRRWLPLAALCLLASLLSWAYLAYFLRGGPRIIDATSYWLEARSLAAGGFTFSVPDPTAAFRGRFLLASADGHTLGVLFPPGYPLVLALGVVLRAPLAVGPVLGGLLVVATFQLSRALGQSARVCWTAALLSVLCAALRYHTADTMSHGLSALLGCVALGGAVQRDRRFGPTLCGLCLGLLVATRPVSAVPAFALCGWSLRRSSPRAWLGVMLGVVPGVVLLLCQQRALTGSFFESTQLAYYAASDTPPGCFRYGFGAGVGCRFEHGDYVARYLPDGFGAAHALRNLVTHLWLFATDATNAPPLTALAGYALVRRTGLALLGVGIALQALVYVPFYFDGNYPGAGARFLSEAIPLCQILVARAICDLRVPWLGPLGAVLGFALLGFRSHTELRDRQGGRPMFETSVLERAGVARGLVLVDSDHGFNLGHAPGQLDPGRGVVVARGRGDARDHELFTKLGRPPTWRYRFDTKGYWAPYLEAYVPPPVPRIEAEGEWPTLLDRGTAYPIHYPCASAGRALRLLRGTRARFQAPWPLSPEGLDVGWVNTGKEPAQLVVNGVTVAASGPGCSVVHVVGDAGHRTGLAERELRLELASGEGALDFISQSP